MADEPLPLSSQRQAGRLAALPAAYRTNHERLAAELALKLEEPTVVFARYGYSADQALALLASTGFAALLDKTAKEVREAGLSFRAKARAMAEDLLPYAHEIATDELQSSAVRADIIQWMARVADLEPPKKTEDGKGGGGGLTLKIVFAGEAPQKVVNEHEPITIEG